MQSINRFRLLSLIAALAAVWSTLPARAGAQDAASPAPQAPRGMYESRVRPQGEPPPVKIEPEVLDFGDLMPGVKVEGVFKISNVGSTPITIQAAMSTCWCTVADLRTKAIEPGATIELPVTYDSGTQVAKAERDILIRFVSYSKPVVCKIRADVNYGVRPTITWDPPSQRRTGVVSLEAIDGQPFRVMSLQGQPPIFADGFDAAEEAPRSKYDVAIDFTELPAQLLPSWLTIELEHPTSPIIELPIENLEYAAERVRRPWLFEPPRVVLGNVPEATRHEVDVTMMNLRGSTLDLIERIDVDPPVANVMIYGMEQTEQGTKLRLKVEPKPGHRGLLPLRVTIVANGHDESLWLMGRVPEN